MPIDTDASIEITAFDWVPPFAQGFVRDLRARWACEEMGLAYRERLISAMERPDWYYQEQPWGQVPYLRDGDIELFESGAILIHLGEAHGLLPTAGQARASVLSWTLAAYNSIEPLVMEAGNVLVFSAGQDWAEQRKPSLAKSLGQRLDRLAGAMGEREWIAGDFSIADIALVTVLREAQSQGLTDMPAPLAAYVERGINRPGFQTALAAQLRHFEKNTKKETEGA